MSYRVSITPTGRRSVDALRGKARRSFDAAVEGLAAEGCAAGDYRLTGEGIEHICALHLCGRYRDSELLDRFAATAKELSRRCRR